MIIARAIRERLGLDRVIVLPSRHPPHKDAKSLADPNHRANMVQLAIDDEAEFVFDDYDLVRQGPCYTVDTVAHFRRAYPKDELFWFIGADSLMELPTWRRAEELVAMCSIITAARPGEVPVDWTGLSKAFGAEQAGKLRQGVMDTPIIDISSTQIRERIGEGKSIRYLVPEEVSRYINANQLYQ